MLSQLQQKSVWEGWLSAEIRANYFADLVTRYQRKQRWMTWFTLALSSGAFFTVITDWLPREFAWVRPLLTFFTAALSFWALVAQNQKNAMDCADLHFRWNKLVTEYESLWDDMYSKDATETLKSLKGKSAELSKSSTSFPNKPRLMLRWQDHVERHHGERAAAA